MITVDYFSFFCLRYFFKIIFIYCEKGLSSFSARTRKCSTISLSMVIVMRVFKGFITSPLGYHNILYNFKLQSVIKFDIIIFSYTLQSLNKETQLCEFTGISVSSQLQRSLKIKTVIQILIVFFSSNTYSLIKCKYLVGTSDINNSNSEKFL